MVWYSQISFSPDIPPSIFFVDKGGNLGREEGHPPSYHTGGLLKI
jgi:hypothetical protein